MTDPTLPRRSLTPVPAPTGMLRAVRAEARRRRVRRLQVASATGTTTLLVVAVLALTQRGSATVGLEPVTPPVVGATSSPAPAPSPRAVASTPPAGPAPVGLADPAAASRPAAVASSSRPGPAGPSARPTAAAAAPTAGTATRVRPPITRSERDAGVQPPCTAGTAVPDWCLAAVVDSGHGGERSTLQLVACPTDRTAEQRLAFGRTEEVRFSVTESGRPVWSSDDGGSRAAPHTVTVTAGRCVVWAVEWDQSDEAGELVEPGTYDLAATSYADEVADAPTAGTSFTVGGG